MNTPILTSIRRAYEAYCRGDIQGAVDAVPLAPNVLWIEPDAFYGGGTYHGRQGVIDYLTLAYAANEWVHNVPEDIIEVGNQIAVFLHFHVCPKGGGQPREGHIADVYTIEHGKVVSMHAYADPAQTRTALGL